MQHDRLLRIARGRDRQHSASNDLYSDGARGETFRVWVLPKIEGAGAETLRRKPLESLVSAVCSYGHAKCRWLAVWCEQVAQRQGVHVERGGEAPGDSGRLMGAAGSPPALSKVGSGALLRMLP